MRALRYTLLADGSSDRTLIPVLDWLLDRYHPDIRYRDEFAESWVLAIREVER